ncbi:MAG: HAMP domain-containing histidine kinase [Planctomycetes bacterium]|nr:HAMP domain-containing histidine kinase [Planctomycetota bacterium]
MSSETHHAPGSSGVPLELHPWRSAVRSPARYAWLLAGSYVLFGTAYIVISTWLAATSSMSVEQMEEIERWKGIAFITVTAMLLFALSYGLFARIRAQEELIARQTHAIHNSERAMLAATFAGTIAHDINNALTASTFAVEELRAVVRPNSDESKLADAVDDSLRAITEWNRRLFDLGSRRAGGTATTVDVDELVANCVTLVRRHAQLRDREIQFTRCPTALRIVASEQLVRRAVLNLVLNAAEACGPNGRISVAVERLEAGGVRIRVDDSGPGVPPEMRAKILEPFFTTKPDGTGLGLASVVACADFHAGALAIDTAPLGGARFDLTLGARPRDRQPDGRVGAVSPG